MNKQRISKTTIASRIKRGWTKEEAENTPLLCERMLTLESVLEIEAHGLSQSKSAYLLQVSAQTLGKFITLHNIQWRGKKRCYRFGIDPESPRQAILKSGLPESTIYMRMTRKHLTIDEAIALGRNSRAKK
mgnify:FL=1